MAYKPGVRFDGLKWQGEICLERCWDDGYNMAEDFGWWALGHNFDIVGAILAMSELSWEKGFEAGRVVQSFTERGEDIENSRHTLYPDTL
jgi:hypothetical protein